jgi:DNA-binding response OmpR family regulator
MSMSAHILVVEDDTVTRLSIVAVLEGSGYRVQSAADGETAIALVEQAGHASQPYDVVITDIRMGAVDGMEVLRAARVQEPPSEVILLTGFGSMESSITALRAGAYDYLIKPCEPTDILSYVAAAVAHHRDEQRKNEMIQTITRFVDQFQRHTPEEDLPDHPDEHMALPLESADASERYIVVGGLQIDTFQHTAALGEHTLHLTPIEYALLRCLSQEPGRVQGYCEIARRTHGYVADKTEAQALLKPHIHNLRRKIDADYFVNVRGVGYMLVAPEQRDA